MPFVRVPVDIRNPNQWHGFRPAPVKGRPYECLVVEIAKAAITYQSKVSVTLP
jgi:hypothetical protein